MTHHTDATNEKAPGACNTEGLTTDNTNSLNFATGSWHGKAKLVLIGLLALFAAGVWGGAL